MQATVSPEQRQAGKREIIRQGEQGASAKVARVHSAAPMHRATVYRLLKRVQHDGEQAFADGRYGHPAKLRGEMLALLIEHCQANPSVSSPSVRQALQERFDLSISVSQLNHVGANLGLSRRKVQACEAIRSEQMPWPINPSKTMELSGTRIVQRWWG